MTGLRQRQHLVQRAARLGIDSAAEAGTAKGVRVLRFHRHPPTR
jgi:hypothetical protein